MATPQRQATLGGDPSDFIEARERLERAIQDAEEQLRVTRELIEEIQTQMYRIKILGMYIEAYLPEIRLESSHIFTSVATTDS